MLHELWNDLRYRIRVLLRRDDADRHLALEIQAHLARAAEQYERQGLSAAEARRQARVAFGGIEDIREQSRDARGTAFVDSVLQDTRYAVRGLAARPLFALGVAVTLALGIGANAAMFGMVDRLLFRPPPYLQDVARVHRVSFSQMNRGSEVKRGLSIGDYLDLKRETNSFDTTAAWGTLRRAVGDGASTRELLVTGASAAYFDLFDARPVVGRFFADAEDHLPTGSPVAVLGYTYWRIAFDGSPDVLGRTLRIGATPFTIVGVAPRDFSAWTAMRCQPSTSRSRRSSETRVPRITPTTITGISSRSSPDARQM
jgi:putative ABC transport system permease protein